MAAGAADLINDPEAVPADLSQLPADDDEDQDEEGEELTLLSCSKPF